MSLAKRMENKRQLINGQAQQMVEVKDDSASVFAPQLESAQLNDLKTKIHVKLVDDLLQTEEAVDVNLLLDKFLESENVVLTKSERAALLQELHSEMHGYGPLDAFLADNAVTEIMVIAFDQVFIEKNRRLVKTGLQFKDDEHVMRIIEKIVSPLGRRIDESTPFVDARLPDGSRVHAIIPRLH